MKTRLLPWLLGPALLALGGPAAGSSATAALIVKVELRHQRGALACALYASPLGFPGEIARAKATLRKAIPSKRAECAFPELPAGDYAVAVVHDENGNGKLDTNFLGMPTEGWGATNNVKPRMSAPTFEQSKVTLRQGQRLVARVRLNY
jgi:uncharacterized protein (DUF2141 family)